MRAADELNVTPGAVSRLVKSLEEYLGAELFVRRPRGIELSEDAAKFAQTIGHALTMIGRGTDEISQKIYQPVLRICCHPTVAAHWLMPRFASLQVSIPDAQLAIDTSLSPETQSLQTYDFIFCIDDATDIRTSDGITSERILDIESYPVCSPAFLEDNPNASSLAEISRLPLLHALLRPNDWDRWLTSAGYDGRVGQRGQMFESLTLAYNAALAGAGIAIGIHAFVAPDIEAGRLTCPVDHVRNSLAGFNVLYSEVTSANQTKKKQALDWLRRHRHGS